MFVVNLHCTKDLTQVAEQLTAMKYEVVIANSGAVYASRDDSSSTKFNSDIKSAKSACGFKSSIKCVYGYSSSNK